MHFLFFLGHRTYVGYMFLEYSTNNAVLVTFVSLLTKRLHANRRQARRQGVELATPTRLYSVQNHERVTDKMVFANGSLDVDVDVREVKGHEQDTEEQFNSRSESF